MVERNEFKIDPSWKGVIKWGGFSLFAAGAIVFVFFLSIVAMQQMLPLPAEKILENPLPPSLLFLLAAIGEALLLPGVLALYFRLKDVKKSSMIVGTGFWLACVPMFLASRGLIFSISALSAKYLATTDVTMKAAYIASAELAIETQNVFAMMGLILVSIGTIIIGSVMLKGVFSKRMAYLVIIAGILTILGPIGALFGIPIALFGLILSAVWQSMVGIKLFKMGKDIPSKTLNDDDQSEHNSKT